MHLKVSAVCKSYGYGSNAKQVLDSINLDLYSGQFLALVGSSGSGKSTIMRLIAGLDRPSSGEIRFDGQLVRLVLPLETVVVAVALSPGSDVRDTRREGRWQVAV